MGTGKKRKSPLEKNKMKLEESTRSGGGFAKPGTREPNGKTSRTILARTVKLGKGCLDQGPPRVKKRR